VEVIGAEVVRQWRHSDGLWSPSALAITCPHCHGKVTMTCSSPVNHANWGLTITAAHCPSCSGRVLVWAIGCGGSHAEVKAGKGTLAIHPHSESFRQTISGMENAPERIQRAYSETVEAYNAGLWNAAILSCRRTVEGIVKSQLPKDQQKGTLYDQITRLPANVDLNAPLIELTHTIRKGGNLGAHFDDERDADQDIARASIELIEFFFEYLYILPTQVQNLQNRLEPNE